MRLRLEPDNGKWRADGVDLQHIRVTAIDRQGRVVPMENGEVKFHVEGGADIVGVDNGDMTNHEINTLPHIHMHRGGALVILRSGKNSGKMRLRAELKSSSVGKTIVGKCELTMFR